MFTCGRPKEYTSRYAELQEAVKIGEKRFGTYLDDVKSTDKAVKHKAILEANLLYLLYEYDEKIKLCSNNESLNEQRKSLEKIVGALNGFSIDLKNTNWYWLLTELFDKNPSVFRHLMLFKDSCHDVELQGLIRRHSLSQCNSDADRKFKTQYEKILLGTEVVTSDFTDALEERPRIKRFYDFFSKNFFAKDELDRSSFGTNVTERSSNESREENPASDGIKKLSGHDQQALLSENRERLPEQDESFEREDEDVSVRYQKILPLIVLAYYEHPQKTMVLTAKAGLFSVKENHLSAAKKLGVRLLKQYLKNAMYDVEYLCAVAEKNSIKSEIFPEFEKQLEELLSEISSRQALVDTQELLNKIEVLSKTEPSVLIEAMCALKTDTLGKIVEALGGVNEMAKSSLFFNQYLCETKTAQQERPSHFLLCGVT